MNFFDYILEGSRMARDARIGAIGAEPIRQLYWEGKTEEANQRAKELLKANTAGIALASGAASSSLLADLLTTAGTTVIDTIGDGDSKNLAKNVAKNAIGDLLGFGAGKALNHFIDLDIINKAFKDGRLRIGEPTTYTAYHQSDNPITQFTFPYKKRWDVVTHGADPNAAFFTVDNPAASGFLSKRPYTSKFAVTVQRPLIQTGEINGATKNSMRNKIVKRARKLEADGVLFDGIADNQLQNQRILMAFDNSDIKFGGGPGKVRYFGPTMGKTTFVKANPDYIDLDSYIKNTRAKAAELLGLEVSDPRVAQSPIYQDAFRNWIIEFQTNNINKGKTLLGSQRQLLNGDFVLDDTPLLPDFATFVERNQSRGFRETPEQLRSWYNGIIKLKPDIKIDNRYISDIISSEF